MSKTHKKQPIPKWFKGEIYDHGEVVRNPFSGDVYYLNNLELSIYDLIMGAQYLVEQDGGLLNPKTINHQKNMRNGLDWFRTHNAEAYMVLLD